MIRRARKVIVTALTGATLLASPGWTSAVSAADWPTWPRPIGPPPETTPGAEPAPAPAPSTPAVEPPIREEAVTPESEAAAKAGERAGKKTAGGIKAGTVGWAVLIGAGIVGIAAAAGGGGGGGGGTTSNH